MRFGFHISIAQGFSKVVEKAQKTKCETIQLFSRNPRGWKFKELNPDEVEQNIKPGEKIANLTTMFDYPLWNKYFSNKVVTLTFLSPKERIK